jgi:hypothetical protein
VREGEEMPTTTAAASQVAVVIGRVRIVVERGFDRQLLREVVGAFGDGA